MLFDSTMKGPEANTTSAAGSSSSAPQPQEIIGKTIGAHNDEKTFDPRPFGEHRIARMTAGGEEPMLTMDFKPERTTYFVDEQETILNVKRG